MLSAAHFQAIDLTIEKAIHLGLSAHENGDGQGKALFSRFVLNTKFENAEASRNLGCLAIAPTSPCCRKRDQTAVTSTLLSACNQTQVKCLRMSRTQ